MEYLDIIFKSIPSATTIILAIWGAQKWKKEILYKKEYDSYEKMVTSIYQFYNVVLETGANVRPIISRMNQLHEKRLQDNMFVEAYRHSLPSLAKKLDLIWRHFKEAESDLKESMITTGVTFDIHYTYLVNFFIDIIEETSTFLRRVNMTLINGDFDQDRLRENIRLYSTLWGWYDNKFSAIDYDQLPKEIDSVKGRLGTLLDTGITDLIESIDARSKYIKRNKKRKLHPNIKRYDELPPEGAK